jgi:sugar lactone lactonase YvrE
MKKLRPWFLIFSLTSSFAIAQSAIANDARLDSEVLISDEIVKARFESELLEAQNFIEASQLMGLDSAEDQEYLDVFLSTSKSMISAAKAPPDTKPSLKPVKWTPTPSVGRTGVFAPNHDLAQLERAKTLFGDGPETIAIDKDGAIYTGLRNGKVIRFASFQSTPTLFGVTGGKPLGMKFHPNGDLIIADSKLGLLAMNSKGQVRVLADSYENKKLLFVNDVAVSASGVIYFTDTSTRYSLEQSELDFIEHSSTGRIFAYDLTKKTNALTLFAKNLDYPNGLAMGPNDEYLVVSETTAYRINRLYLKGAKAGTISPLVVGLPGFPTGITFNGKDRFWFGMASPRIGILDSLAKFPFLRRLLPLIPASLKPKPILMAWAVGVDLDGKVVVSYEDESPDSFSGVTSVIEHDSMIYLGGGFETSFQSEIARRKL